MKMELELLYKTQTEMMLASTCVTEYIASVFL